MKYVMTMWLLIQQCTCLINLQCLQSLNIIYVLKTLSYMKSSINTVIIV